MLKLVIDDEYNYFIRHANGLIQSINYLTNKVISDALKHYNKNESIELNAQGEIAIYSINDLMELLECYLKYFQY